MLEAVVLLAVAAQASAPPPPAQQKPSADLLEFLGEWPDDSAQLIDEPAAQAETASSPEPHPAARPHDPRPVDETKSTP